LNAPSDCSDVIAGGSAFQTFAAATGKARSPMVLCNDRGTCSDGDFDPKFQAEGVAPTNHSSHKTKLNDLSYSIKIWTELSSVLSQSTRLTDGRTDRQTDRQLSHSYSPRWHSMQRGNK